MPNINIGPPADLIQASGLLNPGSSGSAIFLLYSGAYPTISGTISAIVNQLNQSCQPYIIITLDMTMGKLPVGSPLAIPLEDIAGVYNRANNII